MPRRYTVTVPPEWLKPRKGDGRQLIKSKRRLRATLGDADFRRVLAGKVASLSNGNQA